MIHFTKKTHKVNEFIILSPLDSKLLTDMLE